MSSEEALIAAEAAGEAPCSDDELGSDAVEPEEDEETRLQEEEEEAEDERGDEGGSGGRGKRARGGRAGGGGRGSRGGGSRGGAAGLKREEEQYRAALVLGEVPQDLFQALAGQEVELATCPPEALVRMAPKLICARFMALRSTLAPEQILAYARGQHLRGVDLQMYIRAHEEFMHLYKEWLQPDSGTEKKLVTMTKLAIRQNVIQSALKAGQGSGRKGSTALGGRGLRVARAAAVGGGGGGVDAVTALRGGPSEESFRGVNMGSCWFSRLQTIRCSNVNYSLGHSSQGVDGLPATSGGYMLSYSTAHSRHQPRANALADQQPKGPRGAPLALVPDAVYLRRFRVCAATCVAWSPVYTPPPPAAGGADAVDGVAQQSADAARCCILAVGNQLGQVAMWRYGLPASYSPRGGDGPAGRPPAPQLEFMGLLAAHPEEAQVVAAHWLVLPGAAGGSGGNAEAPLQQQPAGNAADAPPHPHSAGSGDVVLLLTAAGDGSILMWSCAAARLRRASDFRRVAVICLADGMTPSSLSATWSTSQHLAAAADAAATAAPAAAAEDGEEPAAAPPPPLLSAPAAPETAWHERVLVVAAAKPAGSVFAWCSGVVSATPPGAPAAPAGGTGAGAQEGDPDPDQPGPSTGAAAAEAALTAACGAGRCVACLQAGAHGTTHSSSVALMPSGQLLLSTGLDGSVRSWRLVAGPVAPGEAGAGNERGANAAAATDGAEGAAVASSPPTLMLQEVAGTPQRLNPAADMGACGDGGGGTAPGVPAAGAASPGAGGGTAGAAAAALQRGQPIHGAALSGNGLVLAVVRSSGTAMMEAFRNSMVHKRLAEGVITLHTPLVMRPMGQDPADTAADATAAAGAGADAAVAQPAAPPHPLLALPLDVAADLTRQLPLPSHFWDVCAAVAVAGARVAAAMPSFPETAWAALTVQAGAAAAKAAAEATMAEAAEAAAEDGDTVAGGGGRAAAGAEEGEGDEPDVVSPGGGAGPDPAQARLAAMVAAEVEAKRRAKITRRARQLKAASVQLALFERLLQPLEAPYTAAAAAAAAASEVEHAGGDGDDDSAAAAAAAAARAAAGDTALQASSLYAHMQPREWRALRCAAALRRALVGHLNPQGIDSAVSELDPGVAAELQERDPATLAAPAALEACCTALTQIEGELLQHHIWQCLSSSAAGVGAGAGAVDDGQQQLQQPALEGAVPLLGELLMSDWVCLHVRHPALRAAELLPLAARVYAAAGEHPPVGFAAPPPREPNPLDPGLPPVALAGPLLVSAAQATCALSAAPAEVQPASPAAAGMEVDRGNGGQGGAAQAPPSLTVMRCGRTLVLCLEQGAWACMLCRRRYLAAPPPDRSAAGPLLPACLYCGTRLAPPCFGQTNFLRCPALELQPTPSDTAGA